MICIIKYVTDPPRGASNSNDICIAAMTDNMIGSEISSTTVTSDNADKEDVFGNPIGFQNSHTFLSGLLSEQFPMRQRLDIRDGVDQGIAEGDHSGMPEQTPSSQPFPTKAFSGNDSSDVMDVQENQSMQFGNICITPSAYSDSGDSFLSTGLTDSTSQGCGCMWSK